MTPRVSELFEEDAGVVAWWGTGIEIVSAASSLNAAVPR